MSRDMRDPMRANVGFAANMSNQSVFDNVERPFHFHHGLKGYMHYIQAPDPMDPVSMRIFV